LQEIGNAEGGFENVGGIGVAEVMGKDAIADQAGDAGEKNASPNKEGETARARWWGIWSRRVSHEIFQAKFPQGLNSGTQI
jgi:hypothetical protein